MEKELTNSQLGDRVVNNIEGVRAHEIECNLEHESNGVYHPRFDDNEKYPPVTEVGSPAAES